MDAPPKKEAIIDAIISWSSLKEVARFAAERHGYGNTDGGFGVIYPDDSSDPDESVIPEGYVEVYGFWGNPEGYELLVTEEEYLDELIDLLKAKKFVHELDLIIEMKKKLTDNNNLRQ